MVLVIDDDDDLRARYKKALGSINLETLEAPDALEVGNLLMREKSNIDLIILDIQIPEVDGRDIWDIVTEYAPNIPIIVSSVFPVNEQRLKIPNARDYFQKSDSDKALLGKVKSVLGLTV